MIEMNEREHHRDILNFVEVQRGLWALKDNNASQPRAKTGFARGRSLLCAGWALSMICYAILIDRLDGILFSHMRPSIIADLLFVLTASTIQMLIMAVASYKLRAHYRKR